MSGPTTIAVGGSSPYDVIVGPGVSAEVPRLVAATRVAVVFEPVVRACAEEIARALREAGIEALEIAVTGGEQSKSLAEVETLWNKFGEVRLGRADAVVAVGGGATTDLVGFAAATWLRGVPVVHVPTTLLAMVDAAVGGKTGINTAAGKNLVGAFHPPAGVVVDTALLTNLYAEQWVNGMAEVIKAGFVDDPVILDLVEADPVAAARPDGPASRELIERSIAMKARVVSADLRESGLREVLNYGHTLGHAVERAEGYRLLHGHAVSIGMVFAAELARRAGRLDDPTADRHRSILEAIGLPTRYRPDALPELMETMLVDKKTRADRLRFVVLDGLAKPGILEAPEATLLQAAYAAAAGA
jgi:3-dehydroquinate synthase